MLVQEMFVQLPAPDLAPNLVLVRLQAAPLPQKQALQLPVEFPAQVPAQAPAQPPGQLPTGVGTPGRSTRRWAPNPDIRP